MPYIEHLGIYTHIIYIYTYIHIYIYSYIYIYLEKLSKRRPLFNGNKGHLGSGYNIHICIYM